MFARFLRISPQQINRTFDREFSCICRGQNHSLLNKSFTLTQTECGRRSIQVYVEDKKDGYRKKDTVSTKQHIVDGFKQLKEEFKIWKEEVKDHWQDDPVLIYRENEPDAMWTFGKEEDRNQFIVTADSDHNEGHSKCSLVESPSGYGLFSGHIDSKVPNDGKIKRAGYCNITCKRPMKSFQRETWYDWTAYNKMVLRVRGDGRPYMIVLKTEGIFDLNWNDYYHFILYTRGGPHWQVSKIPFSRFLLVAKGRVQDKQCEIPLNRISHVGITVAGLESQDGPFKLELDYLGLEYDPNHKEEFAYEMYQMPKFIVGN